MAPIGIAIVGLGKRTIKKALGTIINNPDLWLLVAATDPKESAREYFRSQLPSVPVFESVQGMLEWNKSEGHDRPFYIEAAYIAVPHHCYALVVPDLLSARIHLLKEKPAAMTPAELTLYQDMAKANSTILATASQRRYGHTMKLMKESLHLLGKVASIKATLKICVQDLGEGWRAHSALAGGGAMVDIGWHLLDAIIGLVNIDYLPTVAYAKMFHVRGAQGHDCEDSADVILELPSTANGTTAHLEVSRVGHKEIETITITGEKGILTFDGDEVCIHLEPATGNAHLHYNPSQAADYRSDIERMFAAFNGQVQAAKAGLPLAMQHVCNDYRVQDLIVTQTLQAIYQHANKQLIKQSHDCVESRSKSEGPGTQSDNQALTMAWPIIDKAVEEAVSSQLHKDISIYGNGGVFKVFETEFKEYHGVTSSFALLHNSGTNALHALYFAAGLMPGDEVIFPVYTFHATCSPAMHFGIKPVFCDATNNSTISASTIAAVITTKTKAVAITHMWGIPCDMTAIGSVLEQWPQILLFDACSHAHGARF